MTQLEFDEIFAKVVNQFPSIDDAVVDYVRGKYLSFPRHVFAKIATEVIETVKFSKPRPAHFEDARRIVAAKRSTSGEAAEFKCFNPACFSGFEYIYYETENDGRLNEGVTPCRTCNRSQIKIKFQPKRIVTKPEYEKWVESNGVKP